ncbi:hypothetical protein O6H91_07G039100 [Diphasiastrum complanatum]|uniref:Uncharacterized protein n=1 Tax=Diphasiastrum complanatum TaxID=34168 RepID=A0ACC2D471_DIPCM|nr:hypothetical protein O6H91_07G039100 [Diphasiastrum complanatum]
MMACSAVCIVTCFCYRPVQCESCTMREQNSVQKDASYLNSIQSSQIFFHAINTIERLTYTLLCRHLYNSATRTAFLVTFRVDSLSFASMYDGFKHPDHGMASSNVGALGRMVFLEQTAPFYREKTGRITFRPKIILELISITQALHFKEQQEHLEASVYITESLLLFHFFLQLMITLF